LLSIFILKISSADNFELLNTIHLLCDTWESNLIYANSFMNVIRKLVREKQLSLGNDQSLGKDSILNQLSSEMRQVCSVPISAKVLESRIDELNLKYI
jgi:hypothetical protein